jgi:hypothetical protein
VQRLLEKRLLAPTNGPAHVILMDSIRKRPKGISYSSPFPRRPIKAGRARAITPWSPRMLPKRVDPARRLWPRVRSGGPTLARKASVGSPRCESESPAPMAVASGGVGGLDPSTEPSAEQPAPALDASALFVSFPADSGGVTGGAVIAPTPRRSAGPPPLPQATAADAGGGAQSRSAQSCCGPG